MLAVDMFGTHVRTETYTFQIVILTILESIKTPLTRIPCHLMWLCCPLLAAPEIQPQTNTVNETEK